MTDALDYGEIRRRNERRWGTDRFRLARRLGRDLHVRPLRDVPSGFYGR